MPMLARGAALRFLLTRAYDWLNTPKDALVSPKNPIEYVRRLRFHQGVRSIADYGLERGRAMSERAAGRDLHGRRLLGKSRARAAGAPSSPTATRCKEISGGEALTTNNRMELMAAISALEALKRPSRVELHTDSDYVKNGITAWIHGWKRNGWRTADKKPVKNAELWQRLDEARQRSRDRLALGEGPRRPRRERARRRAGARGAWPSSSRRAKAARLERWISRVSC